jgi:hypothetical protein
MSLTIYPPSGDVIGPDSAVDEHIAVFDGTTGKIIKDGGAIPTGEIEVGVTPSNGTANVLLKTDASGEVNNATGITNPTPGILNILRPASDIYSTLSFGANGSLTVGNGDFGISNMALNYTGSVNFTDAAAQTAAIAGGRLTAGHVVVAKTAAYPIVANDWNTRFTNEGATGRVDFTLPAATAGYTYTFMVQDADGMRVIAATGDTIRNAGDVSAAAGRIDNATIGSVVKLTCINATEWFVEYATGTWTVT